MNQRPKIDLGMPGYEELFMNDQERADLRKPKVEEIPLSELSPFHEHPISVKEDEELERLKDSIRGSGVLVPALVRPKDDGGYELISGHRRMMACKSLGFDTMPVIVRDLTDEEAVIAMVDANLQREHILPSEKAFAYKMKYDALKHQGTSSQVGTKRTDEYLEPGVIMHTDEHVDCQGSCQIRSQYFDNADDKALREKPDGAENRNKYRIRYYNGDTSFIHLEKKSKRMQWCYKDCARLSAEECTRLISGDTEYSVIAK